MSQFRRGTTEQILVEPIVGKLFNAFEKAYNALTEAKANAVEAELAKALVEFEVFQAKVVAGAAEINKVFASKDLAAQSEFDKTAQAEFSKVYDDLVEAKAQDEFARVRAAQAKVDVVAAESTAENTAIIAFFATALRFMKRG